MPSCGFVAGVLDHVHVDDRRVHPRHHLGERRRGAAEARRAPRGRPPARRRPPGSRAPRRGRPRGRGPAREAARVMSGSIPVTPRPAAARKPASSSVGTPSSFALSSLEPASLPATTTRGLLRDRRTSRGRRGASIAAFASSRRHRVERARSGRTACPWRASDAGRRLALVDAQPGLLQPLHQAPVRRVAEPVVHGLGHHGADLVDGVDLLDRRRARAPRGCGSGAPGAAPRARPTKRMPRPKSSRRSSRERLASIAVEQVPRPSDSPFFAFGREERRERPRSAGA